MTFIKNTGKALADVIPGLGKLTFDSTVGTIFITSGTGVIGYRVAMSLLNAGCQNVRVGIWKGDFAVDQVAGAEGTEKGSGQRMAELLKEKGAEIVDFDWSKEEDFAPAVKGVKTVFCTIPHMVGWADAFTQFLYESKKAKVEHFVKISFLRPTHSFKGVAETARQYRENVPFVGFHGTCDDILEQAKSSSRISFTILCTSHLMSTPLLLQGKILTNEHKLITASYGMGVNYVSPNDVADAAVVVLLNQKPHRNKIYNLTASKPIKDSEVVEILNNHYSKPIDHVEMGFHDYAADAKKRGLPAWQVRDAACFERMKASGVDEERASYTRDLEKLIGREPETFDGYLTNKSNMRPGLTFP